jgi:hypothetical protein
MTSSASATAWSITTSFNVVTPPAELVTAQVDLDGPTTDVEPEDNDAAELSPDPSVLAEPGLPVEKADTQWVAAKTVTQTSSGSPSSLAADCYGCPSEDIPFAGWHACGNFDSRYRVVHDYGKRALHPRMERGYARLYCGLFENDGTETRFGYRHILAEHAGDWSRQSAFISRNWRDLVGWVLDWTFSDPDRVTNQRYNRFCYDREFQLYYGDELIKTIRTRVVTGKTGVRIMTAYPTRTSYRCDGTIIGGSG